MVVLHCCTLKTPRPPPPSALESLDSVLELDEVRYLVDVPRRTPWTEPFCNLAAFVSSPTGSRAGSGELQEDRDVDILRSCKLPVRMRELGDGDIDRIALLVLERD